MNVFCGAFVLSLIYELEIQWGNRENNLIYLSKEQTFSWHYILRIYGPSGTCVINAFALKLAEIIVVDVCY